MALAPALRLRPLRADDESVCLSAHGELEHDDFGFLLDHLPGEPWTDFVRRHEHRRRGIDVPDDRVRGAFLLAQVGNDVVGRVSVRFELNEFLATQGGHIGYGVRPQFRRRGHATRILAQALVVARSEGVERALLTCDPDNTGSAAVIVANGGVEDEPWTGADGSRMRRFWID